MVEIIDEQKVREIAREEIANAMSKRGRRSKNNGEKKLNKWQVFLKDCTKRQPEEFSYGDKVKACSIEYKSSKGNGIQQLNPPQNTNPINQIPQNPTTNSTNLNQIPQNNNIQQDDSTDSTNKEAR